MALSDKTILVIAGPSASGKSHIINKLLGCTQTQQKKLRQELDLHSQLDIGKINIERLSNKEKSKKRSKKMRKDVFIIHFDLTSRNQHERRSQLKAIASQCQTLKVVTLEVSFKTWQKRMTERVKHEFYGMPLSQSFWIYLISLINPKYGKKCYRRVYQDWSSLLDGIPTNQRIIFNGETGGVRTEQSMGSRPLQRHINLHQKH